jgi:metal-responsive CopG/Arc/MetJ family transcriptional regulator
MNATKISISLDPSSLRLLEQIRRTYKCASRSQAVARSLMLFKEVTEQHALEEAYAQSSADDVMVNASFANAQADGLANETW